MRTGHALKHGNDKGHVDGIVTAMAEIRARRAQVEMQHAPALVGVKLGDSVQCM